MTMWMVRAERGSPLFQPFVEQGVVAIGWADVGDLSAFRSREEILARVKECRPERKQQGHINAAGVLYRFSTQLAPGDGVVTYDQNRRVYAVGRIAGGYRYDPGFDPEYPNVRPVEWVATEVSRDGLPLATRNSLGSTLTLFLVPPEAEADVWQAVEGAPAAPGEDIVETEEEEDLLEDVAARSVEFIKDRIVRLDWDEMQELVAGLLRAMGYKTRVSPTGPDRGKDIVASPDGFGFEDPRIVVEVKHRPGTSMGSQEIRSFLGGRHPGDKGLYVSTGGFSKDAHYEAERANIPVMLMGLDALVEAIVENYENMDTEARRLVPLRRLYWPVG